MSKHNRERREIRRKLANGPISLVERIKIGSHAARKLTPSVVRFLETWKGSRAIVAWEHSALKSAGVKV